LWDGRPRPDGEEFCSQACRERYSEWIELQESYDREHSEVFSEPTPGTDVDVPHFRRVDTNPVHRLFRPA
jgi:hypothetical protein